MAGHNPLDACIGFDWDEDNRIKNWDRHAVDTEEAEEIFFREPLIVRSDGQHSGKEKRYYALGHTDSGRLLYAAFTIRRNLIRVVSVRDMNRNESLIYRNYEKKACS